MVCRVMLLVTPRSRQEAPASSSSRSSRTSAAVNGYIEEMMNGQKVVKVFCHEEAAMRATSTQLQRRAARQRLQAPTAIANILMPINANMGNMQLCALRGGRRGCWRCSGYRRR